MKATPAAGRLQSELAHSETSSKSTSWVRPTGQRVPIDGDPLLQAALEVLKDDPSNVQLNT